MVLLEQLLEPDRAVLAAEIVAVLAALAVRRGRDLDLAPGQDQPVDGPAYACLDADPSASSCRPRTTRRRPAPVRHQHDRALGGSDAEHVQTAAAVRLAEAERRDGQRFAGVALGDVGDVAPAAGMKQAVADTVRAQHVSLLGRLGGCPGPEMSQNSS